MLYSINVKFINFSVQGEALMRKALLLLMFAATAIAELPNYDHCTLIECEMRARTVSKPHLPVKESASLNWSGYAAVTNLKNPQKKAVTKVQGTWVVPTLLCLEDEAFSAIWVGMDGYVSQTVEQIGTEQDWSFFGQTNFAWIELYPGPLQELVGFPVNIGDEIGGEVSYLGDNEFKLTLVNYTEGVRTVKHATVPNADRSSAEWIVEAPSSNKGKILPLSRFKPVYFTNCRAKINGISGPINSRAWQFDPLTMVTSKGVIKAQPSKLYDGGESFFMTWEHE